MKQRQTVKQTQGFARPIIYRLRVICGELSTGRRSGKYLAELLGVSTKTIYRDLDYMRDMLDMDIESSNKGRTLLEGMHQCPMCGTGRTGKTDGRMTDRILAGMI